jgi:hypothetical protein
VALRRLEEDDVTKMLVTLLAALLLGSAMAAESASAQTKAPIKCTPGYCRPEAR